MYKSIENVSISNKHFYTDSFYKEINVLFTHDYSF